MGGGDLNLKKSWHTQTLRNIEDVWKREQKIEERDKLALQRQKQLREERAEDEFKQMQQQAGLVPKQTPKLEWMYSGSTAGASSALDVDKEAFLLGRKSVDKLLANSTPQTTAVNNAHYAGISAQNEHRDMQNKIRDDPLFDIRMHEKQSIDQVASNPLKVKQILLSQHSLKTIVKEDSYDRHSSSQRQRSRSPTHREHRSYRRSRSRSPVDNYRKRSRSPLPPKSRNTRMPGRNDYRKQQASQRSPRHASLAAEERQAKLKAMVDDAKQSRLERNDRVEQYRKQEQEEELQLKSSDRRDTSKHMADVGRMVYGTNTSTATGQGSSMSKGELHNQIRRKMHTLQRQDKT